MARLIVLIIVLLFIVVVVGGGLFLAYGDFPVPSTRVEKVIPDARFPK